MSQLKGMRIAGQHQPTAKKSYKRANQSSYTGCGRSREKTNLVRCCSHNSDSAKADSSRHEQTEILHENESSAPRVEECYKYKAKGNSNTHQKQGIRGKQQATDAAR